VTEDAVRAYDAVTAFEIDPEKEPVKEVAVTARFALSVLNHAKSCGVART
jgi:hypothetical protein